MYYPRSWTKSIFRLFIYLAFIVLIGIYLENVTLVLLIATVSLIIFNYLHLYQLTKWLWESRKMSPPSAPGVWEHVYEGIYYLQRRNRNKRRNLGELVKRFREGSEALPDAVVVVDKEAKIVWCNRHARIEMGLKWPDDSGRRIDNLIRHPKFIDYFHSGEYQYPIEIPAPTNPNKTFEYRIMAYGEDQLLLIVRDVSRVSQLEEMRKDFVANVSHELRTPLTVINGYLEVLTGDGDEQNPFVNKAMTEMGTQTKRMQALIEDLLILSRIEASAERIYENTIDMTAMLRQVETEAKTLNNEKQHTITFKVDNELRIFGVETEMRSACSNLIFNAIYYTPPGGNIKIIWKKRGNAACFAVIDNGDGIEDKHLRRLTERFYRVDKARSRKTGGSGLGLSIVKHVLNHHNSFLNIESKVGKGSEFSFILPPELIYENSLDS
ncbi:phosphate regulon sensor histidine kinase PhoR [Brumicola pallidula]|jgi:two-component system phosphate regulon sensor histidine kinase PhoR|nr:phosphate regulon sensor histidine kinase PhoR [Glaciecola pallidula]